MNVLFLNTGLDQIRSDVRCLQFNMGHCTEMPLAFDRRGWVFK